MKTNQLFGASFYTRNTPSTISGTVIDYSTGQPMYLANVYVRGKVLTGTATSEDGRFSLNISTPSTIVFSYMGYETIDYPSNEVPSNIYMIPKVEALDEVVITAHTGKKKDHWKLLSYLGLLALAVIVMKKSLDESPTDTKKE